jgi:hypothetical protein
MKDGTSKIIEIKGDNKLDDRVVQRKKEAALALTVNSNIIYRMIPGSIAEEHSIVLPESEKIHKYPEGIPINFGLGFAAESPADS